MRKLQLEIEEIRVESFPTLPAGSGVGTVWALDAASNKDSCNCRPADTAASHANVCCA
jgi:hypothetical protein